MKPGRVFTRYCLNLRVLIHDTKGWEEYVTADVSRVGLFVRTATPAKAGQMLQMRIMLPDGREIELLTRVRQVAMTHQEHPLGPGMGLEFFAIARDIELIWLEFLRSVRNQAPARQVWSENSDALRDTLPPKAVRDMLRQMREAGELMPTATPTAADALRPVFLVIEPTGLDHLKMLVDRCCRGASVFMRTDRACVAGQPLRVVLVHPDTDIEMAVDAVAARVMTGEDGGYAGVQARFSDISAKQRASLALFVAGEPSLSGAGS